MAGWDIEQIIKELHRTLFKNDIAVLEHVEPLAELLMHDPVKGIKQIQQVYDKSLDDVYGKDKAFILSLAGGPSEGVTWKIYNAVGAAYPYLDREKRDLALRQVINIFDGLNYAYVNGLYGVGHTTGIKEPLLLADIAIIRNLYWPGLDEGKLLLKKYDNFFDLSKDLIDEDGMFETRKVNSDFVVAYALLRSDYCSYGEDYIQIANKTFFERVLKAIVNIRFAHAESEEKIIKRIDRLKELLPESIHSMLEPLRQEHDWVDYTKFP